MLKQVEHKCLKSYFEPQETTKIEYCTMQNAPKLILNPPKMAQIEY
jgi:hypothetical protein